MNILCKKILFSKDVWEIQIFKHSLRWWGVLIEDVLVRRYIVDTYRVWNLFFKQNKVTIKLNKSYKFKTKKKYQTYATHYLCYPTIKAILYIYYSIIFKQKKNYILSFFLLKIVVKKYIYKSYLLDFQNVPGTLYLQVRIAFCLDQI